MAQELHRQLSDIEFEEQFESCTLEPTFFTHEAHMRLAWIHIKKYGGPAACENICNQIKRFDIVHDKGEKYNKTVTIAAVKIVQHFMSKSEVATFPEFIELYPRLTKNFMQLVRSHYGTDIFSDPVAKTTYIQPNLLPFQD